MVMTVDIKFSYEFPGSQILNFFFCKKEAFKFFTKDIPIQH